MFRRIGRISRKNRQLIRNRFAERELARQMLQTRPSLAERPLTYVVGLSLALVLLPSPEVRADCTGFASATVTCDTNSPNPYTSTVYLGGAPEEDLTVNSSAGISVAVGSAVEDSTRSAFLGPSCTIPQRAPSRTSRAVLCVGSKYSRGKTMVLAPNSTNS